MQLPQVLSLPAFVGATVGVCCVLLQVDVRRCIKVDQRQYMDDHFDLSGSACASLHDSTLALTSVRPLTLDYMFGYVLAPGLIDSACASLHDYTLALISVRVFGLSRRCWVALATWCCLQQGSKFLLRQL
jgi:hypothetical protein